MGRRCSQHGLIGILSFSHVSLSPTVNKQTGLMFSHQLDQRRGLKNEVDLWAINNRTRRCKNKSVTGSLASARGRGSQQPVLFWPGRCRRRDGEGSLAVSWREGSVGSGPGVCSGAGQEPKARMDQDWVLLRASLLTLPRVRQAVAGRCPPTQWPALAYATGPALGLFTTSQSAASHKRAGKRTHLHGARTLPWTPRGRQAAAARPGKPRWRLSVPTPQVTWRNTRKPFLSSRGPP